MLIFLLCLSFLLQPAYTGPLDLYGMLRRPFSACTYFRERYSQQQQQQQQHRLSLTEQAQSVAQWMRGGFVDLPETETETEISRIDTVLQGDTERYADCALASSECAEEPQAVTETETEIDSIIGKGSCIDPNINEHIEEEDEGVQYIPLSELRQTLQHARRVLDCAAEEVENASEKQEREKKGSNWALVKRTEEICLFKRRIACTSDSSKSPVEYMLTGRVPSISPRSFLGVQLKKSLRALWDVSMKDMQHINGCAGISFSPLPCELDVAPEPTKLNVMQDKVYFRTKWPWPMNDRDYALQRRCEIFNDQNAIVFVSKSFEDSSVPVVSGVVRVDNYRCHTAIFSTFPVEQLDRVSSVIDTGSNPKRFIPSCWNTLNRKGLQFVTVFCDDSKVPLHPKILDMICSHAEKLAPESLERMCKLAATLKDNDL